jgi:hypothetical protein
LQASAYLTRFAGVKVTHIRTTEVGGHDHISELKLETGAQMTAAEMIDAITAGEKYSMIVPEGRPNAGAHMAITVETCADCIDRVLVAKEPARLHRGGS